MSRATPETHGLARQLIDIETRNQMAPGNTPATFTVCDKLRPQLAALMGTGGVHALFLRAVAVAHQHTASLGAVRILPDATLEIERPAGMDSPANLRDIEKGGERLVAELLGLLTAFIGEALTLQMIHKAWPDLATS